MIAGKHLDELKCLISFNKEKAGMKNNKDIGKRLAVKSDIAETLKYDDQTSKLSLDWLAIDQNSLIRSARKVSSAKSPAKETTESLPGRKKLIINS